METAMSQWYFLADRGKIYACRMRGAISKGFPVELKSTFTLKLVEVESSAFVRDILKCIRAARENSIRPQKFHFV